MCIREYKQTYRSELNQFHPFNYYRAFCYQKQILHNAHLCVPERQQKKQIRFVNSIFRVLLSAVWWLKGRFTAGALSCIHPQGHLDFFVIRFSAFLGVSRVSGPFSGTYPLTRHCARPSFNFTAGGLVVKPFGVALLSRGDDRRWFGPLNMATMME